MYVNTKSLSAKTKISMIHTSESLMFLKNHLTQLTGLLVLPLQSSDFMHFLSFAFYFQVETYFLCYQTKQGDFRQKV